VSLQGKSVLIIKGRQKGAFGKVLSSDRHAFRMITPDGEIIYDRLEHMIRAKEKE